MDQPRIPSYLAPDRTLDLQRVEIWLDADNNPFNRRELATEAEIAQLRALRERIIQQYPGDAAKQWSAFKAQGKPLIGAHADESRRETIVNEQNAKLRPKQPFRTTIFMTQEEYAAYASNHPWSRKHGAAR